MDGMGGEVLKACPLLTWPKCSLALPTCGLTALLATTWDQPPMPCSAACFQLWAHVLRSIRVKLLQLWAHATNELHQPVTPQWGHPVAVESCTVWRIASTVHGRITAGTWNCVTSSQVHLAACCGRCRTVRGAAGRQVEVQRPLATCWTTLSRKDSFDALSWPPATSPW